MPRKVQLTEMFLRVKRLRESHDLTQSELSKASGIPEGTIKAWESGRVQDLGTDSIRQLAPVYGMTPDALLRYLTVPGRLVGDAMVGPPDLAFLEAQEAKAEEAAKEFLESLAALRRARQQRSES